jgi:hypothetical protein
MDRNMKKPFFLPVVAILVCATCALAVDEKSDDVKKDNGATLNGPKQKASRDDTPKNVLTADEWKKVDAAVERALSWLAAQQQIDGSFPTLQRGQPGVTSLCVMAFTAHGHVPGKGEFGDRLNLAADFVLSCQKDSGLISIVGDESPQLDRQGQSGVGTNIAYNHAISSLLLSELYGVGDSPHADRMEKTIKKALAASLTMQRWPKDNEADKGGWRYLDDRDESDSDLSVTGWELMFLRSARNAGFGVPKDAIDDAVAYVRRCYSKEYGTFQYWIDRGDGRSRGMAGAGILAMAHAGYHNSPEAKGAAEWILKQKFEPYNTTVKFESDRILDHYHFAVFACCQGMYQLGGKYWEEFFPKLVPILLTNQQADGSWPPDSQKWDAPYGSEYTTALIVMTLAAPNQLLPIFQR